MLIPYRRGITTFHGIVGPESSSNRVSSLIASPVAFSLVLVPSQSGWTSLLSRQSVVAVEELGAVRQMREVGFAAGRTIER